MPDRPKQSSEEQSRFTKSKILRIVSSALIAFCLWFYVISVERTETEQSFSNVEVEFEGESVLADRGLKLISDTDVTVDLKLNGRRSVLNSLRSSDITVRVDLTRIYEAGTRSLTYEIEYPGDVTASDIEVVSRDPDGIKVTVVSWAEKRVNLKEPVLKGTPAEGYRVGQLEAEDWEPKTVRIAGPKEVIDRIQSAGVIVDVSGVSESLEVRKGFVYYDAEGNEISDADSVQPEPEKALVRVPILKEKAVGLTLPISVDKTAEDVEFTVNVTVTMPDGTQNVISGIVMFENNTATLEGAALRQDAEGKIYLDLGGVTAYGSPLAMEYVTEAALPELLLTGTAEKSHTAVDIDLYQDGISCDVGGVQISVTTREKITKVFTGVPVQGIDPLHTCSTTMLTVTVKGFPEDLESVTSANILAMLEEEVTKTGEYDLVVSVVGHAAVTVVGEYPVKIEVPRVRPTVEQLVNSDGPQENV